jgi:protein phosphatase PTC2/3
MIQKGQVFTNKPIADFRGPGVRHQFDHDSSDDYELDMDQRRGGGYGRSGRIILLGDGTEVLTDSDDTDMFDHQDEDKDTENQIKKATPDTSDVDSTRSEREGTPGPGVEDDKAPSDHRSATSSDQNEIKAASDGNAS